MTLRERLRGLGVHPFLIALGLAAVAMLVFALPQGGAQSTIDELYLCSADGHTAGILIGQEGVVDAISTERQTLQAASGTQTGTLWGMYLSASNVEVEDVINDPLDCTLKLRFLLDGRPATGFYRCDGRLEHRPNTYAVRIWLNKTMPLPDAGKCEPGKPVGGDSGHGVEDVIPLTTGGAPPSQRPVQPQPQPQPEPEREPEPDPEPEDQIDDDEDSEDRQVPVEDDGESQDDVPAADDDGQQDEQESEENDEQPQSDPETTDKQDSEQVDSSADESDTQESAVDDTQSQESEGDSSDVTQDGQDGQGQDGQDGEDGQDGQDGGDIDDARDAADLELEEDGPATDDGTGIERTDQVLVQKPPNTGLGGSDAETTSRSSRVTWAIIVLLIAVAAIALDWARRRGDTRK